MQGKYNINNKWLSDFNDLCGTNKHEILTLQIRKDEIINKLTFKTGLTYIWSDGLVHFDNPVAQIVIEPTGHYAVGVDSFLFHKEDHFFHIGWVVEKLTNYQLKSSPNLSQIDTNNYSLDTYLIGNFYFENHIQNAYSSLEQYYNKTMGDKRNYI